MDQETPVAEVEEEKQYLTATDILDAEDFVTEDVYVPEWGGWLKVKGLSGAERDAYEATIVEQRKGGSIRYNLANARAKLIIAAVIDDHGRPLFTAKDVKALGKKSALAAQRVFSKARELAGLTDEDMDELLGNSEDAQSDSSTSA